MRVRELRPECDRPVKRRNRIFIFLCLVERITEIPVRLGNGRIDLDNCLADFENIVVTLLLLPAGRQHQVGVTIFLIDFNDLRCRERRVSYFSLFVLGNREIIEGGNAARRELQRFKQDRFRTPEIPIFQARQSLEEKVPRSILVTHLFARIPDCID